MQSLSRSAVASLSAACSFSGCSIAVRPLAGGPAAAEPAAEGVKATLLRLLRGADEPLTSAELWQRAEPEGLKSKRHMKQMLAQLKKGKQLVTRPMGGGKRKSYGYALPEVARR
eukprot:scaffold10.g2459.t1